MKELVTKRFVVETTVTLPCQYCTRVSFRDPHISGPKVLFKTCVAMKFVDDDNDDDDDDDDW